MNILGILILLPIVEFGSIDAAMQLGDQFYETPAPTYYTLLGAEAVILDHFYVKGGVETWILPNDDTWQYSPILDRYHFEVGAEYEELFVSFYHRCDHPVLSNQGPVPRFGGVTKFSVGYNRSWR